MSFSAQGHPGSLNLQATLSASSATGPWETFVAPHHPITCSGELRYEPDGCLRCDHAMAPPGDVRTQFCLDHSVALLLIELSTDLF
ncbi:MAG: hypothetical protein ACRDZ3_03130 [Acidimicrobiia bacterium]